MAARRWAGKGEWLIMGPQELLNRVADNVSVRRAFGAAYDKDGLLVIPVALVWEAAGAAKERRLLPFSPAMARHRVRTAVPTRQRAACRSALVRASGAW